MIGAMVTGGDGAAPDARLLEAARARQEAAALQARLSAATRHADGTTRRVQDARDRLADETRDVERLGWLSWSRILSSLRGSHATDVEREQAERDAAHYALADAQAREDAAWRDVEALQERLDKLDQVAAALHRADAALGAFSRELADLRLAGVEAVNLDGMTQAFDVFLDNIFTDLRVRSRTQEADRRVGHALADVDRMLHDLSARGREIADELAGLTTQRD
jgi:hypothetical protein